MEAALHNETAYGIVEGPDEKGICTVVYRKNLADLKPRDLSIIRDITLANQIEGYVEQTGLAFETAVKKFSEKNNTHRCRVIEKLSVVQISDRSGHVYKGYKGDGNYCYEIYEAENGSWAGDIISNFVANQRPYAHFKQDTKRFRKESFSGHKLVMRICANDTVAIENPDRCLMRVAKMTSGQISLADIREANVDARNRDKKDVFKYMNKSPDRLRMLRARRVFIDAVGRVKDPGF